MDDDAFKADDSNDGTNSSSGSYYCLHLALTLLAFVSFWVQSVVTEERLVPALNVLADHYDIPDDVAGATLMAAGASSPELLCTLVSLFVTRSSLGLGTIVGSEIFNQLIICAGSVYASKNKALVLDRTVVVREVGFYGLSIGLLYVALSESRPRVVGEGGDDEEKETEYIYVSFWKAGLLFGGYVVYVVACANWAWIEKCTGASLGKPGGPSNELGDSASCDAEDRHDNMQSKYQLQTQDSLDPSPQFSLGTSTSLGSIHHTSFDDHELHQLPFLYNITTEPVENWVTMPEQNASGKNNDIDIANSSISSTGGGVDTTNPNHGTHTKKKKRGILSMAMHKSFKLIKANHLLCRDDYPVEINDVYELTNNEGIQEIGCYLWQRSVFYTKAYFGSHAFHLRWFTIAPDRITSVPDRQEPEKHTITYPLFHEIQADERRLILRLVHPLPDRLGFTLMAPNRTIFDAVLQGCEEYMRTTQPLRIRGMTELDDDDHDGFGTQSHATTANKRDADADPHVTLIELPRNASNIELALWVSVFPLRVIMHYTLPELRHLDHHGQPQQSVAHAYLSTISCLIWLIGGSYVMVTSLEHLAALLQIPDEIMGVTLSAAGTSLPAYIASRIAAEKGFGNQAVANVFGSNTFNICVGLGLPWVIYTALFGSYHDLDNEGILESILVLAGALVTFVILMLSTNFVLAQWHAKLFITLYIIYIVYAVGQVYWR